MTLEERIADVQRRINIMHSIMGGCTSDAAYREYQKTFDELVKEANELEKQLKERK